jgi:hypothetical protein
VATVTNTRKVLSVNEKLQEYNQQKMEKKKKTSDLCGDLVSSIQTIWNNRTTMINVSEQNRSRIKRLRKPERSDLSEALLKVFKQQRSDNASMNGPLLVISFVLPSF